MPRPIEIQTQRLEKNFGPNRVLRGVDLTIASGDLVAVVGGSGCGKTVLLETILGHYAPDGGRVLLADHDAPPGPDGCPPLADLAGLDDEGLDRIRLHWAVVFQRNALFTGSVFENLALWLRETKGLTDDQIRPIARRALDAVGFAGDDTILAKDRDDLSGGMAKRVAIARALAMDPLLMFYDEPTTGLDPAHAAQIHNLIRTTHDRRPAAPGVVAPTTVIVTHDKDLLRRLRPRVVMLHEGTVSFDGPYGQFAASESPIIRPYFDDAMPILHGRPTPG
ncbi:MAG: ATP-binding cassette domain-containing protein [Phycisphaerales bacterium]|nr:ATP-binding cassette domain-containing protein [Phycisphaerales bacterium]